MNHSRAVIAPDRPTLLVIGQPECHLGTAAEGKRGPARSPRKHHCICAYCSVITQPSGYTMRSACVPENWVACGKSTVTIKPILQVTLRQLLLTNRGMSVRFTPVKTRRRETFRSAGSIKRHTLLSTSSIRLDPPGVGNGFPALLFLQPFSCVRLRQPPAGGIKSIVIREHRVATDH